MAKSRRQIWQGRSIVGEGTQGESFGCVLLGLPGTWFLGMSYFPELLFLHLQTRELN